MKQLYTLLLALLCSGFVQAQQYCVDQIRTVTTEWNNSQSSNTWNWTTQFYNDVYIKNRPAPTVIASPFHNPFSTGQNQNIFHFQNPVNKDNGPIDGWELLVKDFGTGVNFPATGVSNPFFALYNRYSATVRVFYLVVDPISGTNNGAAVTMEFDRTSTNQSALLAHASPIINATDRFSKSMSMTTPNRYTNEADYWLFADFPVAYDPCTCLFASRLRFTFSLIQTTNANLEVVLNGTSYARQIIKQAPNGVDAGIRSSALRWVDGLVTSGVSGYKDYSGFQTGINGIADFLSATNGLSTKQKQEAQLFSNLMQVGQTIPYLGGLMGVLDFLTGGGRRTAKDASGVAAFEANLTHKITGSATGELRLDIPRGDRIVKTPGSQQVGTAAVPAYDNVLGLFALLETPKVEYVQYARDYSQPYLGYEYPNPDYDPNCVPTYDEYGGSSCPAEYNFSHVGVYDYWLKQYKLSRDLKFAINPAARLVLKELSFALVADGSEAGWGVPVAASFTDPSPYADEAERLKKMGYEQETDKRVRTVFLPAGCVTETSLTMMSPATYTMPAKDAKIYLKVRAVFKRQDAQAGDQDVIYLATYHADVARSGNDPGNLKFRQEMDANQTPSQGKYHYKATAIPLPLPVLVGNNCRNVPAQTAAQIKEFCSDAKTYNPVAVTRPTLGQPAAAPAAQTAPVLACFPNPASESVRISYQLQSSTSVKLYVLDGLGHAVQTVMEKPEQASGEYTQTLDVSKLPAGLYNCVLETGQGRSSVKLAITR
ncbi:T9SS type A sorting domain-containing protein [Hymenobacter gummosus]|uniref:T9SS type A sorting domain-containing protein n=1 Tax=Hymenobacter gummosus TaxID=1776032 RepID=A0A431U425_9BACT|nr:T9SS type A sorting domain-containing protein [Hymenobacter gummosus]RTQ50670.1 T9SS type A sorting domain-containing protein [Hymenobacter gummosus]